MDRYLGGSAAEIKKKTTPLTRSDSAYLGKLSRVEISKLSTYHANIDAEDVPSLSLNAVETEANRCFNCGCEGVNLSDIAPALVALNARIVTSQRSIDADDFWMIGNSLRSDILPVVAIGGRAVFIPNATTWDHEHVALDHHSGFHTLERLDQLPAFLHTLNARVDPTCQS